MRRALCEDFSSIPGCQVVVLLDERFPDDPGSWTTVRVGPGQVHSVLAQLSSVASHTLVVAPETGGLLASCASIVHSGWLGSDLDAIELCTDKARLADHLCSRGLRVPDHWIVNPGDPWPTGAPDQAVLKPIDGAGSLETRLVNRSPRLEGFLRPRLLQSFHRGTPMSASFLVDARGRPFLVGIGTQRLLILDSELVYQGGMVPLGDPSWADAAARAVKSVPGLSGWVGVDFVREESGECTILEINPRVTTSLVGLRSRLPSGTIANAWLALAEGDDETLAARLFDQVHSQPTIRFHSNGLISQAEPDSGT